MTQKHRQKSRSQAVTHLKQVVTFENGEYTNLGSTETRMDPLRFQARCRRRRLNLALVYFVL